MTAAELRADFWTGFREQIANNPHWGLSTFSRAHANDAYMQFEQPLGIGFRPRAIFLAKDNELRAEILTQAKRGIEHMETVVKSSPLWRSLDGSLVEASFTADRSSAKFQVVWHNAMIENRRLWPVHHHWLGISLCDLIATFKPVLLAHEGQ